MQYSIDLARSATGNIVHFLQQPFHCEIEHKIGLTCWSQGPVTCRVRLDRGGYVPGEAISIWATITNNSKVQIKHTRASLTEVRREGRKEEGRKKGRKKRSERMTITEKDNLAFLRGVAADGKQNKTNFPIRTNR